MRYLNVTGTDPYTNLALEEFLLSHAPRGEDIFLLWQNADTVVVGRYQNTTQEVDTLYARRQRIEIARRITGGGAVYHDLGNVNFSFIGGCARQDRLDLSVFSAAMAGALRKIGFDVQVSGRNDLTAAGRKCSGSAQTVKDGRVLHHGTLLFQTDLARMQRVLTVDQEKLAGKGVDSVRSRVVDLAELAGEPMDVQTFKQRLLESFVRPGADRELCLTQADWESVRRLREERYVRREWIYGRSPGYTVRKERRFPAGKVELLLETKKGGRIGAAAIQGDFFGSEKICELERRLTGAALEDDALRAALEGVDVGRYIAGISTDELIGLILA